MRYLVLATLLPVAAMAQEMRDGDEPFDSAGLTAALSGQTLVFFDGSFSVYGADAEYEYRYEPGGRVWTGAWETTDGSAVCVAFDNGSSRCDTIVRDGERLVLITGDGLRFPVREVRANGS